MHGLGCGFEVVGVNDQGFLHRFGGAAESGQHEDARVRALRGDKFLGDEVHAVTERGHEADVRLTEEVGKFFLVI